MRRRSRQESSNQGSWLTTYSDMVTLLLAFFVLLFAFSSVDVAKFQAVLSAFQRSIGVLDGGLHISDDDLLPFQSSELGLQQLQGLYHELSELFEGEDLSGVHLQFEERGLIIRFADQVFFDLGKANLKPEAVEILKKVAPTLRSLPNPLRVEGHTDDLPIRTSQFPSNWELSVHRATNVVRYLVEEEGFDPKKLSAAGYSEYRPLVPNSSDANRQINRRVDIIVMNIDLWDHEPN